jgi:hypothetical protein
LLFTSRAWAVCGPSFGPVASQSAPGNTEFAVDDDHLLRGKGIAVLSATDAWAVGHYDAATYFGPVPLSLIEHWNGAQWSAVPHQRVSSSVSDELLAVAAAGPTDVWAVGDYVSSGIAQALIEHWNGVAWSLVPSPFVVSLGYKLTAITALAANDVWAVGVYEDFNTVNHTLIEHWNGIGWSVVPSPNRSVPGLLTHNVLLGVAAISSTNVLAVGTYYTTGVDSFRTLAERWNGVSWQIVPSQNLFATLGQDNNLLLGVTAGPTGTAWAVGAAVLDVQVGNSAARSTQPIIERWDGTMWRIVQSPNYLPYQGTLYGVAMESSTNAWAVGGETTGTGHDVTLIEHWDGTAWSRVQSPNLSVSDNDLYGVDASAASRAVMAVGSYLTGTLTTPGVFRPLVEQACGV